jgi:S-formylglutathione hydrolase FrmB
LTAAALAAAACLITATPAGAVSAPAGGMQATLVSTAANGIATYTFTAPDDGPGPQTLRVLPPTHPAPGVPHNFLYVLPVETGLGTEYGDGLQTLSRLNAENRYNLTIVEPTFPIDPWYANVPNEPYQQYESFMAQELVPWVKSQLSTTGHEHNQLLGFSKSGLGAQDLILRHPQMFSAAASWDFPAGMVSYVEDGAATGFGNETNFQTRYELSKSFLGAHRGPFEAKDRIWIGGGSVFSKDVTGYDALLTAERIKHTTAPTLRAPHRWEQSWVQKAMAWLR